MGRNHHKKRFGIRVFAFVAGFVLLSAETASASGAYIENVELNRNSVRVSTNSFKRGMYPLGETGPGAHFIDQLSQIYLYNVYATVTVKNDGDENFNGFLTFREKAAKDYRSSEGPFNLPPHTSKSFILRIPCSVVQGPGLQTFHIDFVSGFFRWEWQTVDTYPITLDIRDTNPTFDGPAEDEIGETVLFSTAVERDTDEFVDSLISTGNLFCMLATVASVTLPPEYQAHECFEGAGKDTLVKLALEESIKDTPNIILKGSSLDPQNYYRDFEISWRDKISSLHGTYIVYEVFLNYDRAVIILKVPEEVGFISASPQPDKNYVNNQKRILIWIINGVDKSIEPSHIDNTISIRVQEPYSFQYTAAASLMLQFGPFEDKIDLLNLRNKPPKYDYITWETNPGETVWLTVASATDKDTFSTRVEDLGYNPIFTGFPYDLVPDYGATPQINLNSYLNNDLPPAYVSQLTFESVGYGNIEVEINQSNQTADIILPPDWKGEERIDFIVRDGEGRSDIGSIWINSIIPTILQNGQVSPASGSKDDLYTFSVTYRNPSNTYPKRPLVIINDIPHNMEKKPGRPSVKDGAIFEYTGKLSTTNNNFYFEFGDEQIKYRYPEDDVILGPDIAELHDIAIKNFNIYPQEPEANDIVEVRAQIENLGTQREENIPVAFKVNGVVYDSKDINVPVEQVSPVTKFSYQIPISDYEENYELRIEAGPVAGETNTADNSDSVGLTIVSKPGAISGWVFDQWNNPIEGATIKVIESATEDYGSTKSDSDGYYYLDGLKPTPNAEDYYTLEAYKEGEGSAIRTNVAVHTQQTTANQIFNLYPAGMTQVASGRYLVEAAWSPNGDKLAFRQTVEIEGENYQTLYRVNEDGSGLTRMTGPDKPVLSASNGGAPTFSPDGTKIVFRGKGTGGYYHIWLTNAAGNGGDAYVIIPWVSGVSWGTYPTWSPDGQKIAYVKVLEEGSEYHEKIYVYNIITHADTYLRDGDYRNLAWSPDGNWIACLGYLIDASTGEEIPISASSGHAACWLPDSTGIVYDSGWNIWLYYLDTEEKVQITFDAEIEWYPSIPRNDGTKIAFVSNKGFPELGDYGLFIMPFSPPRLYFTDISAQPDPFTPNGDGEDDYLNVSYNINKPANVTLKIHDSQGHYVRTLADNELQDAGSHSITWDGKNQYGLSQNAEVYFYRLDMHDADETAIPVHGRISMIKSIDSIGSGLWYPRWSHLGDKIVYLDDSSRSIYICDANDFTDKQIVPTPFDVGYRPAWSANDDQIVFPSYSGNTAQIATINIDGNRIY